MRFHQILRHLVFASALLFLGCATYQNEVASARDAMYAGNYDEALKSLEKKIESSNGDQLAYILEYGTVLHQAGRYEDSNKAFARAEKLAELNDYTSVSRETGAMVVQEGITQYKAEIFEFLLISIYQALNYIMLGDYDNAQVMARKLNEKINKFNLEIDKESKKKQLSFAAYLAALMWESQGDWDNAYVLYAKALEAAPTVDVFKRDALIAAKRSGRETDYNKLKNKYPELDKSLNIKNIKGKGEFIFVFQQGWIARKQTRPENRTFPMMVPVPKSIHSVDLYVDDEKIHSEKVYDLDIISIQALEASYAKLVARAVARQASRIAVREASRNNQDNALLGVASIASLVLEVMDTADLRQWSTLPASFQVARVYLPPGKHKIKVMGYNNQTTVWEGEVQVLPNKKVFKTQRAY